MEVFMTIGDYLVPGIGTSPTDFSKRVDEDLYDNQGHQSLLSKQAPQWTTMTGLWKRVWGGRDALTQRQQELNHFTADMVSHQQPHDVRMKFNDCINDFIDASESVQASDNAKMRVLIAIGEQKKADFLLYHDTRTGHLAPPNEPEETKRAEQNKEAEMFWRDAYKDYEVALNLMDPSSSERAEVVILKEQVYRLLRDNPNITPRTLLFLEKKRCDDPVLWVIKARRAMNEGRTAEGMRHYDVALNLTNMPEHLELNKKILREKDTRQAKLYLDQARGLIEHQNISEALKCYDAILDSKGLTEPEKATVRQERESYGALPELTQGYAIAEAQAEQARVLDHALNVMRKAEKRGSYLSRKQYFDLTSEAKKVSDPNTRRLLQGQLDAFRGPWWSLKARVFSPTRDRPIVLALEQARDGLAGQTLEGYKQRFSKESNLWKSAEKSHWLLKGLKFLPAPGVHSELFENAARILHPGDTTVAWDARKANLQPAIECFQARKEALGKINWQLSQEVGRREQDLDKPLSKEAIDAIRQDLKRIIEVCEDVVANVDPGDQTFLGACTAVKIRAEQAAAKASQKQPSVDARPRVEAAAGEAGRRAREAKLAEVAAREEERRRQTGGVIVLSHQAAADPQMPQQQ